MHIIFLFIFSLITGSVFAATLPVPSNLIAYDSQSGKSSLIRSMNDQFLQLSQQFLTQKTQTYCGVASISMVLNALKIEGPDDPLYNPFHPITQDNFFTPQVEKVIPSEQVSKTGMTLDAATTAAAQFGVVAQAFHSDTLSLEKMRQLLKSKLETKNEYVIVNFFRPGLGEQGGGHFSPIAAYDKTTDRFLLLDVARYKYPPVWVKSADLWKAIDTTDPAPDSHKKRGILVIKGS